MPTPIHRTHQVAERFQELKEFILEWHGAQEIKGATRTIGRTPQGEAVALIWEDSPTENQDARNVLTAQRLCDILEETKLAGLTTPVFIWAEQSTVPTDPGLYRFAQVKSGSTPEQRLAVTAAIAASLAFGPTRTLNNGGGISVSCPFLDAADNRWVPQALIEENLTSSNWRNPTTTQLESALTDIGSRRKTFRAKPHGTSDEAEITAWFVDRPLDHPKTISLDHVPEPCP